MKKLLPVALVFALVAFVACLFNFFSTLFTGKNPLIHFHLLDIPILAISILAAILYTRYYHFNNFLHLWQGIIVGSTVWLLVSVTYAIFLYYYLENFGQNILFEYIEALKSEQIQFKEEIINQLKITEAEFMANRVNALNATKAIDVAQNEFVRKLLLPIPMFYFLVIFISSLALRKVK